MADQLKVQAAEEAKLMAEKTAEEEQKQVKWRRCGLCRHMTAVCRMSSYITSQLVFCFVFNYDSLLCT
jgi:hypothetical protein